MNNEILAHHGIKGQKWGVRRFQNADGSRTAAGLAHDRKLYAEENGKGVPKGALSLIPSNKNDGNSFNVNPDTAKKVAKAALIAGGVAAAGYLYATHATEINNCVKEIGFQTYQNLRVGSKNTVNAGKEYVGNLAKQAYQGAKEAPGKFAEGVKEGLSEVPKNLGKSAVGGVEKVAKGAVEGAAIIAAKKMMESSLGQKEMQQYTQAYNAYNKKKKIGQVNSSSNEDDDDDD